MLDKNIEAIDGLPLIYINSINAVACSDLHLGYESVASKNGAFLPKKNLENIKAEVKKAIGLTDAKKLIITGDIKNDFSAMDLDEFNEMKEFAEYVKALGVKEIILIRGNHDNFVARVTDALGIHVFEEEYGIGRMLFSHGDEIPKSDGWDTLIMGHVHPDIALYSKLGVKEKVRCILYGNYGRRKKIVILPAMNYYASGVDANIDDISDMSPLLKCINIESLHAFGIGDAETLDFGRLADLRQIAKR